MKLSVGSAIAVALWAAVPQAQVLPSGPGSLIPLDPDDRPLLSRPGDYRFSATGLDAGIPGPFLPNPSDATRVSPMFPGSGVFPFVGK
ncbi:MAG TPA: hypothetical protein VKC66_22345 [Xanthobacteraceae bacterium]|nr:hypothetical protein [Xanthobacteraceae bacterium]